MLRVYVSAAGGEPILPLLLYNKEALLLYKEALLAVAVPVRGDATTAVGVVREYEPAESKVALYCAPGGGGLAFSATAARFEQLW